MVPLVLAPVVCVDQTGCSAMSLFQDLQHRRARVLFVCLANSGRSQMAETLAQAHASDVLEAFSAGIQPASQVSKRAVAALTEKGLAIGPSQKPKNVSMQNLGSFDVIVNLCDYKIPKQDILASGTIVLNMPI